MIFKGLRTGAVALLRCGRQQSTVPSGQIAIFSFLNPVSASFAVQRNFVINGGMRFGVPVLAEQIAEGWIPSSEPEKAAVQQQLEKLLATPLFNSSKRYPSFLHFVVTKALAGQTDQLKERILGMEIFGREADYNTNVDAIVRVTAAEIRKRIEHYYQDPKHSQEIRIFLPAGSYVPQFSWPGHPGGLPGEFKEASSTKTHEFPETPVVAPTVSGHSVSGKLNSMSKYAVLVSILLIAGLLATTGVWYFSKPPILKQFWEPFVKSTEPVLFCIADQNQYSTIRLRDAGDPQRETTLNESTIAIVIDDVSPLVNVAGMLRTFGKNYRVQGQSYTSLTDLRRGPTVFIGAYDNGWTLRLTSPLRFHFANDPAMSAFWIEDRANPKKRDWILDRTVQQKTGTYKDYAIVARFVDPNTDQYVVIAAGIGRGGTIAAGEFLVDSHRMSELLSLAQSNWKQKNIEIVLETQVIQDRSGPPRISAVHVW
jgi:hypothetical protein